MRHEVTKPILVNATEGSLNLPVDFAKMAVSIGRRGQADFSLQDNGTASGAFFQKASVSTRHESAAQKQLSATSSGPHDVNELEKPQITQILADSRRRKEACCCRFSSFALPPFFRNL